ncbi:Uncharacterised protein [Vibrio cholerae]|nr:Uncharacterised protein [Vibrio cholerae]
MQTHLHPTVDRNHVLHLGNVHNKRQHLGKEATCTTALLHLAVGHTQQ